MKPSITTKLTKANIAAVLKILEESPKKIESMGNYLSEAELVAPLGSGERSLTEDLAHLINCEARSSEAIYLALLLEEPLIHKVHPERQWGKLLQPESLLFADLLKYFSFRRNLLLRVIGSLSDAQWQRAVREDGKKRKESVYWLARTIAMHEWEHLVELTGKLKNDPGIRLRNKI